MVRELVLIRLGFVVCLEIQCWVQWVKILGMVKLMSLELK